MYINIRKTLHPPRGPQFEPQTGKPSSTTDSNTVITCRKCVGKKAREKNKITHINIFMYMYILYISKICIYLHICIEMGVPRWEWADEGGEMGVGRR